MATYNTSEFRKGLKVQIDGEPYLMVEMNFVKPGKGNALYKCRMKNLIRGTMLDRTYKGGDSLESADVVTTDVSFLYRQGEDFVFMDSNTYEQYEVDSKVAGDIWKYLKDGMQCTITLYNGNPILVDPPIQVELEVTECAPRCERGHRNECDEARHCRNGRGVHRSRVHQGRERDQSRLADLGVRGTGQQLVC